MIKDKVFYLYHTDFCAVVTEALNRAVTVTATGGLAGGISQKPSVLLLADANADMPESFMQDGHTKHQHSCMGNSRQE